MAAPWPFRASARASGCCLGHAFGKVLSMGSPDVRQPQSGNDTYKHKLFAELLARASSHKHSA